MKSATYVAAAGELDDVPTDVDHELAHGGDVAVKVGIGVAALG